MESNDVSGGPLVIGLGGVGIDIVNSLDETPYRKLCMDTDHRTIESADGTDRVMFGSGMLSGEGCGGNMNLGRSVMGRYEAKVRELISGGRPLINVFGSGGGTGVPFAVEISKMCLEMSIPFFNICIKGNNPGTASTHGNVLASILLSGPLKPGCLTTRSLQQRENEKRTHSYLPDLSRSLDIMARCYSEEARIPLPVSILDEIRKEDDPIGLSARVLGEKTPYPRDDKVLLAALSIPGDSSNRETYEIVEMLGLKGSHVPIGITISDEENAFGVFIESINSPMAFRDITGVHQIEIDYLKTLEVEGFGMDIKGTFDTDYEL